MQLGAAPLAEVEFFQQGSKKHSVFLQTCSIREINGLASRIEPNSNLEVGLTTGAAAAHAACSVTSALWEFNYCSRSRAAPSAPHRLAAPNKPLMNIKRRWAQVGRVVSSVMDPAPRITATRASFTLYLSNKVR